MQTNIIPLPTPNLAGNDANQPVVATLLPPPNECAITVRPCKVRTEIKWRVRYSELGKVKKAFFDTEEAAKAKASELRGDSMTNKKKFLLLPPAQQDAIMVFFNEVERKKINWNRLYSLLETATLGPVECPTIKKVVEEMMAEKNDSNCDDKYIKNLEQSLTKFMKGRETMPINRFTAKDIRDYFTGKTAGYKKSLRARLSTLFIFAKREKYRTDNPCDELQTIKIMSKQPAVFTVGEAEQALKYLVENPKALGWFINSSFAGLRPEDEATSTGWDKIDFKKKLIVVEAEVSKTGKRRVVYPPDMVFDWLKVAKELGTQLPLTYNQVIVEQRKLRVILWGENSEWKQDVTRHSAASYWLAMTNDVKKVSRSLGHSIAMLESTYDARVLEDQGHAYYGLTPEKIMGR